MGKLFGAILESAVMRKINHMRFAAGQVTPRPKCAIIESRPYSKCTDCGKSLAVTEVYGEWEDYCIDCYLEDNSKEK